MARPRKNTSSIVQLNLTESFTSLFLGALVVLVGTFLVFAFAKNRVQTTYDKINTAVSTFQQPQKAVEILKNQKEQTLKTYEVKSGESLWSIAEKVYGSGYNWVDLAKTNNLSNPGMIFAGNKLVVPVVQKITIAAIPAEGEARQGWQSAQNNSPSISGDSYKIVKGDNLWTISIRAYGDGFKWPEIARVNNIPNPNLIYADNTLKLP